MKSRLGIGRPYWDIDVAVCRITYRATFHGDMQGAVHGWGLRGLRLIVKNEIVCTLGVIGLVV